MSAAAPVPMIRPPRRDGFPHGPNVPGSARWLSTFFGDPVEWYCRLRDTYGDLVGLRAGPVRMIVCFDADLLEQVLLANPRDYVKGSGLRATQAVLGTGLITADGDLHRRHRRIAAPLFTPRTIEPFAAAAVQIAREVIDRWPSSGVRPLARDCYDISLRVAGVGLFGSDFDEPERERLHAAMRGLDEGYRVIVLPGGRGIMERGLTRRARRMRAGRDHVDRVVRALIAGRRLEEDPSRLGDLLSRLLAARDGEDGARLDDEEVRDEAVTMLLAGHDTTAATLAWCLALLALHPRIQQRLHEEVDDVLGSRDATATDLRQLRHVRSVVDETQRLHPSIYSTVRDPVEPVHLPGGHVLPPGTDLVVPIAAMHRDPRHWEAPTEFRPERFLDGDAARERHRMAYLPFGTGPRVCIGSSFALQELVLVLATIMQRFELAATPGWQLRPQVGFIRRPAGDLALRLRRRPQVPAGG